MIIRKILIAALLLTSFCAPAHSAVWPFHKKEKKMLTAARQDYAAGNYYAAIDKLKIFLIEGTVKRREKRAYLLLGECYEALGRLDFALNTYVEGAELNPKSVELQLRLGELYFRTDLIQNSIDAYQKALTLAPANKQALLGLARAYNREGFFSKSEKFYHKYIADGSPEDNARVYAEYAHVYFMQRKYNEALFYTALSIERSGPNINSLVLAAKIYRINQSYDEAFEYLDHAIELAAQDEDKKRELTLTKGFWLLKTGDYKAAQATAQEVLKTRPNMQLALFLKALAQDGAGNKKQAKKTFEAIAAQEAPSFISRAAAILLASY